MANKSRVILSVLASLLYGFMVFLVYLYLTFPYDIVQQRLVEELARHDLRLSVQRIGPGLPPGLHLHDVRLFPGQSETAGALLQLQTLQVQPAILQWLSQGGAVRLTGDLYGGQFQGNVRPAEADGAWEVRGQFTELELGQHVLLQRQDTPFLRGRLRGNVTLAVDPQGAVRQGEADVQLAGLVFRGEPLQLPLRQDITCDTVQTQLKITPGQLQVMSFTCRGTDLLLEARGTIAIRSPLPASALRLRVRVQSENTYNQEIALLGNLVRRRPDRRGNLQFSIRGTLQQPQFGA